MCVSEKVTFPVMLWKNIHKYLCYVTGVSASQGRATDAHSEMPAYTQKYFSDIPRIRNSASGGCGHKWQLCSANAGAQGSVWFQQRAEWECISANKPITASLENCILNGFLLLLLSSLWAVKGFDSFIPSLCLPALILPSKQLLFVTI